MLARLPIPGIWKTTPGNDIPKEPRKLAFPPVRKLPRIDDHKSNNIINIVRLMIDRFPGLWRGGNANFRGSLGIMKRRYFSLVEVMVVLALIALLSSAFLVGVGRLLRSQQFRTAAVEVEEWLTLAQEIMLIYQFDVGVTFENRVEGVYFQLHGEPPCKRKFSLALEPYFKEPHLIKGLSRVSFWQPGEGLQERGEVQLSFWTPGTRMSKGLLFLYEKGGNEKQVIQLPGYPSDLHSKYSENWEDEQEDLREALYPTQVGEG